MTGRKFFVGGNWKMNGSADLAKTIVDTVNAAAAQVSPASAEIVVAPPYPYLSMVRSAVSKQVGVAAQNVYAKDSGAYTGEVSAPMLRDLGISHVILGHSERRELFGESDAVVAEKVRHVLARAEQDLVVIACIGEKLAERESNTTYKVLERQLGAIVDAVKELAEAAKVSVAQLWERLVVAYEPVWAIGTGKVATPEQAQEVHAFLRKFLAERAGATVSESVRIIYGGSVNGGNAAQLALQADVDGFLVGGASLKPEFAQVCAACKI